MLLYSAVQRQSLTDCYVNRKLQKELSRVCQQNYVRKNCCWEKKQPHLISNIQDLTIYTLHSVSKQLSIFTSEVPCSSSIIMKNIITVCFMEFTRVTCNTVRRIKAACNFMFSWCSDKMSCLSCSRLNKGLPASILSLWKHSMGTERHTHPFNAVSLWCASSHAYYITGLLLPGLTPLANLCTLCYTWAIYTLHPRQAWSKIPLQSIIHWETFQNRSGSGFGCAGIDRGAHNK